MPHASKLICTTVAVGGIASSLAIMVASVAKGPDDERSAVTAPAWVTLRPGLLRYRPAGDYSRAGAPVDSPETRVSVDRVLVIMKYQVTAADYQRCVEDHACAPLDPGVAPAPDRPAVGISWRDAVSYSGWLSRKTGAAYRLPTDAEWAYAAGSRFHDDALPQAGGNDPARRWLARYEEESDAVDKDPRTIGSYGANENGLVDLAGNVWEWTNTCLVRHVIDETGRPSDSDTTNCGIRVVEGRHRTYVADFVRDMRVGGCMAGAAPANLGLRLVRDDDSAHRRLRSLIARVQAFLGRDARAFLDFLWRRVVDHHSSALPSMLKSP